MPSPFPGMDPYLESPIYWRGFQNQFISTITAELNRTLPEGYSANSEERLYVLEPERILYPDAAVLHRSAPPPAGQATGTAAALLEKPPLAFALEPEEVREPFVEIREVVPGSGRGRVVTVLELLSPANKAPGSEGQRQYRQKQRALLDSDTNLVEIDLLRGGDHTLAMPRAPILARQPFDYLVCRHRADTGRRFDCWPFSLRDPLPLIGIPLLPDHPDLPLDLQTLFERAYDAGPYLRDNLYVAEPDLPLSPSDAAWADALLRERGFRFQGDDARG